MTCPITRDEWIAFFEAIPDEWWLANGHFKDDCGRYCARGHVHQRLNRNSEALMDFMRPLTTPAQAMAHQDVVSTINDRKDARYQQPTPRARILAALRDLP